MAQQKNATKPGKPGKSGGAAKTAGRGGARQGAGRKSGSGAFGEATVPMRVPVSLADEVAGALADFKIQVAAAKAGSKALSPMAAPALRAKASALVELAGATAAGKPLDLSKMLAAHPESCLAWTSPQDFPEWGIKAGDVIVIDRARPPAAGSLAAFWVDGAMELLRVEEGPAGASARRSGSKKPLHQAAAAKELPAWGVAAGVARRL